MPAWPIPIHQTKLTWMKTCLPSGESCRSVADCQSASSNLGSACALSFSSAFFFFSASSRVCSISLASSALMNFWLSVSRGSRLRGWTSVSCAIFAALERDDEQVVVAGEGDRRFAPGPAGIGFVAGGARNLAARARNRVEQHDVAAIDEEDAAVRRVPSPVDRRCAAAFLVGEPAGLAAIARDHPGGRLIIGRLTPFEVQARGITGPAESRSADIRPASARA